MRNFDDYLSPYPCLGILQKRLKWYRQKGVSGVILNGSGDDYAAFDDMQTTVLAQLLKNPDLEITSLIKNYYSENYPLSGQYIAEYYLFLEKKAMQAKNGLPYYGGIGDEVAIYLNPTAFLEFDHQLDKVSKTITGTERHQLNQLLTGFNYTHDLRCRKRRYLPYQFGRGERTQEHESLPRSIRQTFRLYRLLSQISAKKATSRRTNLLYTSSHRWIGRERIRLPHQLGNQSQDHDFLFRLRSWQPSKPHRRMPTGSCMAYLCTSANRTLAGRKTESCSQPPF